VGKSVLGQQVAAHLNIGWVSTDLLADMLRVNDETLKAEWDASPGAIKATAEWFFPYLERFVWGVSSQAENYLVEGVSFLPTQVKQLASKYPIRSVFLGCSEMTLEKLDKFPGRSVGYGGLPEASRRQIAKDVPLWSEFIQRECEGSGYSYVDMADDFPNRLIQAESILTTL
jgi:hypothetical protein